MQDRDVEELHRLWDLKEKGAISEDEYLRLKSKILGQDPTSTSVGSEPPSETPLPGTTVEFRNKNPGLSGRQIAGIGCAAFVVLMLIVAAIGSTGSNSPTNNSMNVDENLTTTDMNATAATSDVNVAELEEADHRAAKALSAQSPNTDTPAAEQAPTGLPSFDTEAYCQKIGDTAGGSYEIEETCRDEESKALAQLNARSISGRTLQYCSRIGETAGGSYEIMETCVEQELESAGRL
jgi:hypothetical protein